MGGIQEEEEVVEEPQNTQAAEPVAEVAEVRSKTPIEEAPFSEQTKKTANESPTKTPRTKPLRKTSGEKAPLNEIPFPGGRVQNS